MNHSIILFQYVAYCMVNWEITQTSKNRTQVNKLKQLKGLNFISEQSVMLTYLTLV